MKPFSKIASSFFIISLFGSCTVTNIYLVRHSEKVDGTAASALTPKGERRAIALRDSLIDKKIDLIFTTDYLRTKLTAKPLADALKKNIIIYNPGRDFSAKLKRLKNKSVLVVGHTNTIPETIRYITTKKIDIAENEFDKLYVIRIKRLLNLNISLETKTYGEPSAGE